MVGWRKRTPKHIWVVERIRESLMHLLVFSWNDGMIPHGDTPSGNEPWDWKQSSSQIVTEVTGETVMCMHCLGVQWEKWVLRPESWEAACFGVIGTKCSPNNGKTAPPPSVALARMGSVPMPPVLPPRLFCIKSHTKPTPQKAGCTDTRL